MASAASVCCVGAAAIEGDNMKWIAAVLATVVLQGGPTSNSATAQDRGDRTVEQYMCKDIVRESGANRDVAIAFLRGFLLGKSGSTKFNIDVLHNQSDEFIEHCLVNPDQKALDAMSKVIG
jgi:hypothetical protein